MQKAAVVLLLALFMVSAISAMDVTSYYVKVKAGTFKAGDMLEMADMDYGVRFSASAGVCWRNCCFLELSAGHVGIDGGAATAFESRKWDQQDIMLTAGLRNRRSMLCLYAGGGPALFFSEVEFIREAPDEEYSIREKDSSLGYHLLAGCELTSRGMISGGIEYCITAVEADYGEFKWKNGAKVLSIFLRIEL